MAKIKYYYDTESCKYIRVKTKTGDIFLNALGIISLTLAMAVGLLFWYSNYFESPKDVIRMNEIKNMEFYYDDAIKKVNKMAGILKKMAERDDNIYRVVLGAEPIDKAIREAGVGGVDRYEDIKNKDIAHE